MPHQLSPGSPRVVAVVGATASGKSVAAARIASAFHGEVINSDSRLFYKGLDIGTAKPSSDELAAVPHHLISFLEVQEQYSLARFLKDAGNLIDDISAREKLSVVAGGTGQYVWGLLKGWQVPEIPADPELRSQLESELDSSGVAALFERLEKLDPRAAESVDSQNPRRVIRALERVLSGIPSPEREAIDPGYNSLVIGLHVERAVLHTRIAERVDAMLAEGWLDEVRSLLESGVDFDLPAMSAIGYREMAASLRGEMTIDEARERTIRNTNRLVRHQNNWFKPDDPRIKWIDVTDGDIGAVEEQVKSWL